MRRAALIYNTSSGRQQHLRLSKVEAAAAALRSAGVETSLIPTHAPGSGADQAQQALASGHDVIFACGGDGTMNDVLQGMVSCESNENSTSVNVPLGIVPLGTGNVLAHDLGIPIDPVKAIEKQLAYAPRRISAGKIEYRPRSSNASPPHRTPYVRFFTIMAGIGADAEMLYRVTAQEKTKLGVMAYNLAMIKLALVHPYIEFRVEAVDAVSGHRRSLNAVQIAAVRICDFGGLLQRMAPEASLLRDDLQLILFTTTNRLRHFQFMTGRTFGLNWKVPGFELMHTREINCFAPESSSEDAAPIHAQVDGEFLGCLPAKITVVPDAFSLLMPKS